jgi:hypothetical protein
MDSSPPSQTPEFLCWAIEQQCPLRELLPANDPEKVERQMRAARAVAEARQENRVQGDLAVSVDGQLGFHVADALALYGGEEHVATCCERCPANIPAGTGAASYAGCFGQLPMPDPREAFLQRVQKFPRDNRLFAPTKWLWYGFWIRSPLEQRQLTYLASMFLELAQDPAYADDQSLKEFADAIVLCIHHHAHLSVRLFPEGEIADTWWNLKQHCPVCHAPWELGGGVCAMCGQARHPASPKKRHARGTRPYRPLEELA